MESKKPEVSVSTCGSCKNPSFNFELIIAILFQETKDSLSTKNETSVKEECEDEIETVELKTEVRVINYFKSSP